MALDINSIIVAKATGKMIFYPRPKGRGNSGRGDSGRGDSGRGIQAEVIYTRVSRKDQDKIRLEWAKKRIDLQNYADR